MTRKKCNNHDFSADLTQFDGQLLPYSDDCFDVIIAWQVLNYNDESGFRSAISEIDRVLKPGGMFIGTMPGARDMSRVSVSVISGSEYSSTIAGQYGARLFMPDKASLVKYWSQRALSFVEFEYRTEESTIHHLIVSYFK